VNICNDKNSLLLISFFRTGITFLKLFKNFIYSNHLKAPIIFLAAAAAKIPTKKFNKVTEINFVDRAKAATPTPPLIAAHLNLLKLNLFFDFE